MKAGARMHEFVSGTAKASAGSSTRPLISICIPTYNFGAFIGETLESPEKQDLSDVEIIWIGCSCVFMALRVRKAGSMWRLIAS